MRAKRSLWMCAMAVLFVVFPLRTCFDWLHPHPDHKAVRRFRDTELAVVDMGSDDFVAISVSPDDRWLVFAEHSVDFPELREVAVEDRYRIGSIDLISGAKKTHRPPADLPKSYLWPEGFVASAGAGWWVGGVFVLHPNSPHRKSLVLDPAADECELRFLDTKTTGCSDCAPVETSGTHADREWSNFRSHAWRPTSAAPVYYKRTAEDIVRVATGEDSETVISANSKWRFGMVTRLYLLRVSPDGRFLAYIVLRDLVNFLPFIPGSGWTEYLYVRDMHSGRDKQLAERRELSNLVWSSDSRRLYFSGTGVHSVHGPQRVLGSVCVADMADVFGR